MADPRDRHHWHPPDTLLLRMRPLGALATALPNQALLMRPVSGVWGSRAGWSP